MLQRKAVPREGRVWLPGKVALRVQDVGAERPRVGLAQRLVDRRRQAPRLGWQVDREDVVHSALERVEDGGVRTLGAALREGGSDPRDGADVARLWVAAELALLLEEEVLYVGVVTDGCPAPFDAVGPVHLGDSVAHGLNRRGQELRRCLGVRLGRRGRVVSRRLGLASLRPLGRKETGHTEGYPDEYR